MQMEYETDRLLLKILTPKDVGAVLDFYRKNDGYLKPFEPERPENFFTEAYHEANLLAEYNAFIKFSYLRLWMYEKENPKCPVGTVCYSNFHRGFFQKCSVGYKTDYEYTCRGYATEVLHYTLQLICEEYGMHRVEALTLPDTDASIHVLEKLGFQKEGYLHSAVKINGEWRDHKLYALIFESSHTQ